jgi:2'-5' RNA ligase
MMRLFIAATIDDANKKIIYDTAKQFKQFLYGKASFTRVENIHVTLKFLGEVEKEFVQSVESAIDMCAQEIAPFKFTTGIPGIFKRKEGALLYLGIDNGAQEMWSLASVIDDEFVKAAFKRSDKPFNPHITIGRRIKFKINFNDILESVVFKALEVSCNSITLMESFSEKGIVCYKPLYSASLKRQL